MHVRCANCHAPIVIAEDTSLSAITCPSCGSNFSLVDDPKTSTILAADLRSIGHFDLLEQLGAGAFGTVWKARDTELDRIVAVKIPRKDQLGPAEVEQFVREARAAAQLNHPNIVSVHEVGRDGDTVYIVSDFVHGVSLDDWLTGQQASSREAAELCVKLADALHHAHQQGVIHRDLKPGNVIIDSDGEPHLMDFGLAKREAGEITMTVEGRILGTPAYMSPEQARGEGHKADRRTDIYSLGVMLYQLLTGELPFRGNARMLLFQVLNEAPRSPRSLNDRIPKDLETISLKALDKDPGRRFATAADMADDLRRYLRGEPILSRPISRMERGVRWVRRNPVVAALTAGIFVALTAGTVVSSYFAVRASRDARLAIENSHQAEKQKAAAESALVREQQARAEEEKQRAEADSQRKQAQANLALAERHLGQARSAVNDYFTLVSTRFDPQLSPDMEPLRKELLQSALKYYETFLAEHAGNKALQAELAATHLRVGQIHVSMAEWEQALDSFEEGFFRYSKLETEALNFKNNGRIYDGVFKHQFPMEGDVIDANPPPPQLLLRALPVFLQTRLLLERLTREHPEMDGFQADLAGTYFLAGSALGVMGQQEQATRSLSQGAEILEKLAADNPNSTRYLRRLNDHYGLIVRGWHRAGQSERVLPVLPRIVSALNRYTAVISNDLSDLLNAVNWLTAAASCTRDAGQLDEAMRLHAKALELSDRAFQISSNNTYVRFKQGNVWSDYARTLIAMNRHDEASKFLTKALKQLRLAFEVSPRNSNFRSALNAACQDMATVHRQANRAADAMALALERKELWPNDSEKLISIAAEQAVCAQLPGANREYADLAMQTLNEAVSAGFKDVDQLEQNRDLDPLRSHPGFQELVTELKSKTEAGNSAGGSSSKSGK